MKISSIIFFILYSFTITQSQDIRNDARFVIGIEGNYAYKAFKNDLGKAKNHSYGINIGLPLKQFSFEVGLINKSYLDVSYYQRIGEAMPSSVRTDWSEYYYSRNVLSLNYIVIANRLQYRLPCNCIFVYAGYDIERLRQVEEKKSYEYTNDRRIFDHIMDEELALKKINTTVEVGLGFKMHITDDFRIVMRQSYHINNRQTSTNNKIAFNHSSYNYLSISLGFQKGFL